MSNKNIIEVDFSKKNQNSKAPLDPLDKDKYDAFSKWINEGTVCVLFDARSEKSIVPHEYKSQGDLRLNFCYQFHIEDFTFDAESIRATLSFDSGDFFCQVPWGAIYALQSDALKQGAVWFEDFPSDYNQVEVLGFDENADEDELNDESLALDTGEVITLDFPDKKL